MKEGLLEKIILETEDIQSLPNVAAKVLQLINNEKASIGELEDVISKDQAFSTRLLRIANSAYYGRGRNVDAISTAIIRVGFNTMKSLVLAASLKDLHRRHGLFEQRLWEHTLAVSIAASMLAEQSKLVQPNEAFIGGMLHDVGKVILNNSIPEMYALIIERFYEEELPFTIGENEMLGFDHCKVGGLIARKWKLPKNLETAIEYHHSDHMPDFEDNDYEALCQIIGIADAICLNLGIGMKRHIESSDIGLEQIGLSWDQLKTFHEKLMKSFSEMRTQLLE